VRTRTPTGGRTVDWGRTAGALELTLYVIVILASLGAQMLLNGLNDFSA
jgi:hypothetical protein